jgi:hypothetical protein
LADYAQRCWRAGGSGSQSLLLGQWSLMVRMHVSGCQDAQVSELRVLAIIATLKRHGR